MKRLALFTTVVVIVVIGALALWRMYEAVTLLLLALALAAGLTPDVRRLVKRGWARPRAVALVFGGMVLTLILSVLLIGPLAYSELFQGIAEIPPWYDEMRRVLAASGGMRAQIGSSLPTTSAIAGSLAANGFDDLGPLLVDLATRVMAFVVLLISIISLGFYWLVDQQHFERLWLSLLPLNVRVSARAIWERVYEEMGIYVRGEAMVVFLTVLSLLSVYTIVSLPGATLLAVIGGLAQVVPLIGLPLAILPALLVALIHGPQTALMTAILGLTALGIIKGVITPKLFSSGININPVLVIVLIMLLAELGGPFLILLALPLAATIQSTIRVLSVEQRTALASDEARLDALQDRLDLIEAQVDGTSNPRFNDMLTRARKLLESADATISNDQLSEKVVGG